MRNKEPVVLKPDSRAAKILSDPKTSRYFSPFLLGPASLSSAAKVARATPQAMRYWVKKFLGAGLIRPIKAQPDRRSVQYVSSSQAYLVPFQATKYAFMREWVESRSQAYHAELIDRLTADLEHRGLDHLHIFVNERGKVIHVPSTREGQPSVAQEVGLPISVHGFTGEIELCEDDIDFLNARHCFTLGEIHHKIGLRSATIDFRLRILG